MRDTMNKPSCPLLPYLTDDCLLGASALTRLVDPLRPFDEPKRVCRLRPVRKKVKDEELEGVVIRDALSGDDNNLF